MKLKFVLLSAAMMLLASPLSAEVLIKKGESIAFLGDSITQHGNNYPVGYLHLVEDGFRRAGIPIVRIPAGISGHKSNDMLKRLERDVLRKKPTWMTLSCGVNDVWHGPRGVKLEDYKKNITAIVDQAQKAGIKVMILTATMIYEDPGNALNRKLAPYNDFLRQLARERKLAIADLNAIMQKQIQAMKKADPKPSPKKRYLTRDGVHMARAGNIMMAAGILAAFGIPEQQIAAFRQEWMKYPEDTRLNLQFTMAEWEALLSSAKAQNMKIQDYAKQVLLKDASGRNKH